MLRIGITGGIGTGKSTVSHYFQTLYNIPVIDADEISRQLISPEGGAYQEVVALFGHRAVLESGQLNRKYIRNQIFEQQALRHALEAIIHPKVADAIIRETQSLSAKYCLIVIPLLIESNMQSLVDRILVVHTEPSDQLSRVANRDQCAESDVESIIKTQLTTQERLAHADDIISNTGTVEELIPQIRQLHQKYMALGD